MRLMLLSGVGLVAGTFMGLDAQIVTVSERPVLSIGQIDGDSRYLLSEVSHVMPIRQILAGRVEGRS